MKTTFRSIIVLGIISLMTMSFTLKATEKNNLLIQPVHNTVTSTTLTVSAKIISDRLKEYGIAESNVTVIPDKNQIQVTGINDSDRIVVQRLITQRGRIEFYRAYNQSEFSELIKSDVHLSSILNKTEIINSGAKIGCTSLSEVKKVTDYLKSSSPDQKCRYVWGNFSDTTEVCLYALRLEQNKGPLLTGNDLDNVNCKLKKASNYWYIDFRFKKPVIKLWSDITKQNIGNTIAIVIDNQVICAPVINTVIEGGKCQITGNFTKKEVKLFASFGNHGELPVSFDVVN